MDGKTKNFLMILMMAAIYLTFIFCGNDQPNGNNPPSMDNSNTPPAVTDTATQTSAGVGDVAPDIAAYYTDNGVEIELGMEAVPLAGSPAVSGILMPEAIGTTTYGNDSALLDCSHLDLGYFMVKYKGTSNARLKVIVQGPSAVKYTYNLNVAGKYEVFPVSDGDGQYKVTVYQNTDGNKYTTLYSTLLDVQLTNQFAPFLMPNQYVNYTADCGAVKLAATLTKDCSDTLAKVGKVYDYVITNIVYDKEKAKTVQSGYLPNLEKVLNSKKGICFDYAALMTAMLRSQNVPCKLVVGYTGDAYHAWINVYSQKDGWIDGVIFFDGTTWKLMDPTFAASGKSDKSIMEYIGNGANYQAKYLY